MNSPPPDQDQGSDFSKVEFKPKPPEPPKQDSGCMNAFLGLAIIALLLFGTCLMMAR